MLNTTKPIITGSYPARRAAFERYAKGELSRPGSRPRHYLYLAAIAAVAVAVLLFQLWVR